MISNFDVAKAWSEGRIAQSGRMRTDGSNLYSYNLRIGFRYGGHSFVINYMGTNMYSMTTSHHVSLAKEVADRTIEPGSFEHKEYLKGFRGA